MIRSILSALVILTTFWLTSCNTLSPDDFENPAVQTVKVGEKVKIYYTTDWRHHFCSPNMESLAHLTYIGEEVLIPHPTQCDVCDETMALIFEAKSKGTDTVFGRVLSQKVGCSDTLSEFESFVIHIK